jgi:hypothetical protein
MKTWVVIDCRKTRKARDHWLSNPDNTRLKNLGSPNQLSRILGTEGGVEADYARVTRNSLVRFADKVEIKWGEFRADLTMAAFEQWYSQWKVRREALKQEKLSATNSQHRQIEAMHKDLRGYYELYHQATAKKFSHEISVSLVHVEGIDLGRPAIKCELHDNNKSRPYFHLLGHIVPRLGFLYWELGSESLGVVCHAICYSLKGNKFPGATLRGIFMTVSGDDKFDYPIAAKGIMRFLGETPSEARENCILEISADDGSPQVLLQQRIGGYLSDLLRDEPVKPQVIKELQEKILPMISNVISADATPLALVFP